MDGFTAATTIRNFEKILVDAGHNIIPLPIVAVSANSIESKSQCLAVGMQVKMLRVVKAERCENTQVIVYRIFFVQGYIAKPIRKPELAQNLNTFGCVRHSTTSPLIAASPQTSPPLASRAINNVESGNVSPATDAAGIPQLHILLVEDNLVWDYTVHHLYLHFL